MGKDFENPWGITTTKGEIRMMSSLLNSAVFPGVQGGPLEHVIASKAVSFGEALDPKFRKYQENVKKNAEVMAMAFIDRGYKVISDGTDNHLMLVDLTNKGISGKKADKALEEAGITVNKNMIPFDTKSPFVTSGIRIGTPAVTTRGMKEADMDIIAELINRVISDPENEQNLINVKNDVKDFCSKFPLYSELN